MQVTILENPWIPITPTPKQAEFLLVPDRECLYGGAAGGGKSEALLAGALQYVDVPGYAALLLRRTYSDLSLPGALMDRASDWLTNTPAKWSSVDKTWTFPSGATLTFGYLESEKDKYRYQSSEFQYIGFDELTQFSESQYTYMFSRLRRLKGSRVPIRMRSGSNPGGVGHEWVENRFIKGDKLFIPARLEDNPHLDQEEYLKSLSELDPITRKQLLEGDWSVTPKGDLFNRDWFQIVDDYPRDARLVRHWDLAATRAGKGSDPDYTVGLLLGEKDGVYYVIDVQRMRGTPMEVERRVVQTAHLDGVEVVVSMEEEPGSSGKNTSSYYRRLLAGYTYRAVRPTGSKRTRASPVSSQAEAGNIKIVRGRWNKAFLDELVMFDEGAHDDQVDALSGAFEYLTRGSRPVRLRARSVGRW